MCTDAVDPVSVEDEEPRRACEWLQCLELVYESEALGGTSATYCRSSTARPKFNAPPSEILQPLAVFDDICGARNDWGERCDGRSVQKRGAGSVLGPRPRMATSRAHNRTTDRTHLPVQMVEMSSSSGDPTALSGMAAGERVSRGAAFARAGHMDGAGEGEDPRWVGGGVGSGGA